MPIFADLGEALSNTGKFLFFQPVKPDLARRSGLYEVQITVQTPFPGTPLYDRLRKEERLIDATAWETCTLFDVNFRPTHMTVAALEQNFRALMAELYTESARRERKGRFRQTVRRFHPPVEASG